MEFIESAFGDIRGLAIGVLVSVAAAALFVVVFLFGRRVGQEDAVEAVDRLESERDGMANELGEAQLDLRDAQSALGEAEKDVNELKLLLGERELAISRLERRIGEVVERSSVLGGQYEGFRARIRAAVDGEVWTRALSEEDLESHAARRSKIPIVAIGNFKGGVGKTTIAANLGAYFADVTPDGVRPSQRVLFIDLDFQGSLSQTLSKVSGVENENRVLRVFDEGLSTQHLLAQAQPVNARSLNGGCRYFDCDFAGAEHEEKLLFDWVSSETPTRDLRLCLANFLLADDVQASFDLVILDMPPRGSTFAHNALAAATHLIVATKHDVVSADAIARFVDFVEALRPTLCPHLKLLGIAPNMLRPQDSTRAFVEPVMLDAARRWRGEGDIELLPQIPLRASISGAAGRNFAYLEDALIRRLFTDFGDAVARRL